MNKLLHDALKMVFSLHPFVEETNYAPDGKSFSSIQRLAVQQQIYDDIGRPDDEKTARLVQEQKHNMLKYLYYTIKAHCKRAKDTKLRKYVLHHMEEEEVLENVDNLYAWVVDMLFELDVVALHEYTNQEVVLDRDGDVVGLGILPKGGDKDSHLNIGGDKNV